MYKLHVHKNKHVLIIVNIIKTTILFGGTVSENTVIGVCWTHTTFPSCKLMYVAVTMTARQLTCLCLCMS